MDHQPSLDTEPTDDPLTILADPHCRAVLTYFRDTSSELASIETLADEITTRDHGEPAPTTVQLHHVTLPRLAKTGAVEYDARSNTARYWGHPELETLLDALPNH